MITSKDNPQLKTMRRLHDKRHREREGLCLAEGEDLVDAALAAGLEPELLLRAGEDVEPRLLDAVSTLGSGTRVIGVFPERWAEPGGELSVYLHGVADPGNVGTVIRSAHALADGPVVLGPGCADPFSPKALRASMGSAFARPPARAGFDDLPMATLALLAHGAPPLAETAVEPPVAVCLGAEREGLPEDVAGGATARASIPLRPAGPDSLNVAMAATVALYELNRMAGHA
ncbi:MAG: TrmH family RNA methyltransferase [Thermoleophilaceae bacterium]